MLRNYFKIAWRNTVRTIGYSTLNILGLATGMTVALLIGLWVYNEYTYDRFLPEHDRLYRVQRNYDSNGDTLTFLSTSLKLADALRSQVSEIEYVAENGGMGSHGLMVGDKKFYLNGGIVGPDFLKMFRYPFITGNAASVFNDAYSIVLTESTAKALFGNEDPLNKMVLFDNEKSLKVTGILKDIPANSSIAFNYLVPFTYLEQTSERVQKHRAGSYSLNAYQIYVKLKPGIPYAQVAPKIRNIEHTETGSTNAMKSYITLQPLERWHLYSNYVNGKDTAGFLEYVIMFSIIGLLVLVIACINFINLTTARSEKRAREVGVRKAIGSLRKDLVIQFLIESLLLTFIAFILSLALAQVALTPFNALTGSRIEIPFANPYFWIIVLACMLITGLAAGSRPAFYLSSFQPVKVLKGTMRTGHYASLPRKVLVVMQFSCSIALIISTMIIYRQVQHAKERPSGYNLTKLLTTAMNKDLAQNFPALKDELIKKGIAESVTTATSPATDVYWHSDISQWPGKLAGETVEMGTIIVSGDYFKTVGMAIAEGRDFINENDTTSVVFNEAAIKRLRIKSPVNQTITWGGNNFKIAGVVKDALMISPFSPVEPTMFFCSPEIQGNMLYKLSPQIKTQEALTSLTALFNKYNPAYPYKYSFEDENYAAKFKLEILIGRLAAIFATLAILISCLGLFGLAAYMAEQRTKEVGIRRVLGASVSQVWLLLSKEFVGLVLISVVVASPVAFYFLQNWLLKYNYRITIGPGVFLLAGLLAIVITLLTVSFQAIKAAIANPVKALKNE